jgi:colicin import membrane protein
MQDRDDTTLAAVGTTALHVLALALMWLSGWIPALRDLRAPGPAVETSVEFTAADVQAAHAAAAKSQPPPPPPRPQQLKPQEQLEKPDTEDVEAVVEVGEQPSEEPEVREERTREAQVDLTEDIERQREAENRERLREQLEEIRKAREEAERMTKMEEQRLRQLADRQAPVAPKPGPATRPQPPSGSSGQDSDQRARYLAAINATARENWNTRLAPERTNCRIRFQQIPGGEVINVEFMDCPYDAQGRESVERALRKTNMPYSGFESVFTNRIDLTFCHPDEACQ